MHTTEILTLILIFECAIIIGMLVRAYLEPKEEPKPCPMASAVKYQEKLEHHWDHTTRNLMKRTPVAKSDVELYEAEISRGK